MLKTFTEKVVLNTNSKIIFKNSYASVFLSYGIRSPEVWINIARKKDSRVKYSENILMVLSGKHLRESLLVLFYSLACFYGLKSFVNLREASISHRVFHLQSLDGYDKEKRNRRSKSSSKRERDEEVRFALRTKLNWNSSVKFA
jgi:hypothetical protein